jgi:AcrR family transcriptional regulator
MAHSICGVLSFEQMIKSNAQSRPRTRRGGRRAGAGQTRERILEATLSALGEHGYAATTARVIATRGGFPVGLIFYHFGTLDDLLLAVLDHTSAARLPRWQEALAEVYDVRSLLERMHVLYQEDVVSAHALAVKELVANGGFSQRLAPELAARMEPWFALAESVAGRVLAGSPLLVVLPARDLAMTAVALYLGLETVSRLSGEPSSAERLFAAGAQFAPLLGGLRRGSVALDDRPTRLDIE